MQKNVSTKTAGLFNVQNNPLPKQRFYFPKISGNSFCKLLKIYFLTKGSAKITSLLFGSDIFEPVFWLTPD